MTEPGLPRRLNRRRLSELFGTVLGEPPVVVDRQQDVCRLAAIGDDHGPGREGSVRGGAPASPVNHVCGDDDDRADNGACDGR